MVRKPAINKKRTERRNLCAHALMLENEFTLKHRNIVRFLVASTIARSVHPTANFTRDEHTCITFFFLARDTYHSPHRQSSGKDTLSPLKGTETFACLEKYDRWGFQQKRCGAALSCARGAQRIPGALSALGSTAKPFPSRLQLTQPCFLSR